MFSTYQSRKVAILHTRFNNQLSPTFMFGDNVVSDTRRNENLSLDLGRVLFYNLREHFSRNNMFQHLATLDSLSANIKRTMQEVMKYEVIKKKLNEI